MSGSRLPNEEQLAETLTSLLGKKVEVVEGPGVKWNSPNAFTGATYKNKSMALKGGLVCDVNFAAYCGAALTISPAQVAKSNIDTKVLDSHIFDAYAEVVNILAGLLNQVDKEHLALKETFPDRRKASDSAKKYLGNPSKDMANFDITIEGYGPCHISIFRT